MRSIYQPIIFLFTLIISLSGYSQVKFEFAEDEYDFGVAEEGANLTHVFEFTNAGKDTIYLDSTTRDVRPGCGCTAFEFTKTKIAPGGKGFVKAGFPTMGRLGPFEKNITVSQKGQLYNILFIKGYVIKKEEKKPVVNLKKFPILSIDKREHNYGKIEQGQNVSYRFVLKNTGKDTLKIISSYSACNCINYKILNPKDNAPLKYVLPGKTVNLEISYMPKAPGELRDNKVKDKITLFTNDPKLSNLELTLSGEVVSSLNVDSPVKQNENIPFQK